MIVLDGIVTKSGAIIKAAERDIIQGMEEHRIEEEPSITDRFLQGVEQDSMKIRCTRIFCSPHVLYQIMGEMRPSMNLGRIFVEFWMFAYLILHSQRASCARLKKREMAYLWI